MYTKPISTEVIASYEATLISGFAPVHFKNLKFVFGDTPDELTRYWQQLVDACNNKYSPSMIMIDDYDALPDIDDHMQAFFQAVVAYPYVLKTFEVPKTMVEWLQHLIMEHLNSMEIALDNDQPNLIKEYFASVDNQCEKTSDEKSRIDAKLPDLMGASIKNGSFFKDARLILNYPSRLLPSKEGETPIDFQIHYKDITHNDNLEMLKGQYLQLLPVLYIIAKIPSRMVQKPMTQEEKNELTIDLYAAKYFYEKLFGGELTDELERLHRALESVKSIHCDSSTIDPVDAERLPKDFFEAQPIYRFLLNFHFVDKWWSTMSIMSTMYAGISLATDADLKYQIQNAFNQIEFFNAFRDHVKPDQVKVLKKMTELLWDLMPILEGHNIFDDEEYMVFKKIQEKFNSL